MDSSPRYRWHSTPVTLALTLLGAGAWIMLVVPGMAREPAMMLSLPGFLSMWTVMVAAMMLPSVAPLGSRYVRMIPASAWVGLVAFLAGYLVVWAAIGVLAYLLAWGVGAAAIASQAGATAAAVILYLVCGLYQFTPLKNACLAQCRAPLALLLCYAAWRGRSRHVRVGLHHGLYCAGCCWPLMALMVLFGMMNLTAMLILTVITTVEKVGATGLLVPRLVGVACLALALATIWIPALAPSLIMPATMDMAM